MGAIGGLTLPPSEGLKVPPKQTMGFSQRVYRWTRVGDKHPCGLGLAFRPVYLVMILPQVHLRNVLRTGSDTHGLLPSQECKLGHSYVPAPVIS
jgi:hypothetical protein